MVDAEHLFNVYFWIYIRVRLRREFDIPSSLWSEIITDNKATQSASLSLTNKLSPHQITNSNIYSQVQN